MNSGVQTTLEDEASGSEQSQMSESLQRRSHRWRLLAATGAIVVAGLAIAPRLTTQNSRVNLTPSTALLVQTTVVERVQSYKVMRTYTGEVTATRTSEIGFERSGALVWVGVDRGDRVQAGEVIARLDTQNQVAQLNQLRAQKAQAEAVLQELRNGPRVEAIASARAQVSDLQNQLALETIRRARREYLQREGAISKEQLDEVAYNRKALQDRLVGAQSQLAELENGTRSEQIAAQVAGVNQLEASIVDLEITITKSTLKAPFSGVIGERRLDEGAVVNPGEAIVRLVEADAPEVEVGVPADVSQLQIGSSQWVQIGQNRYAAKVIAIKPEVNPATRTRTVVLAVTNANSGTSAPVMVARLEVMQTVATQGLWLPTTALTRSDRGLWSCFVLVENTVERRDVEVLHTEADRVLVRGLLKAGDRVVTVGVQRLVPGQQVQR